MPPPRHSARRIMFSTEPVTSRLRATRPRCAGASSFSITRPGERAHLPVVIPNPPSRLVRLFVAWIPRDCHLPLLSFGRKARPLVSGYRNWLALPSLDTVESVENDWRPCTTSRTSTRLQRCGWHPTSIGRACALSSTARSTLEAQQSSVPLRGATPAGNPPAEV